MPTIVSSNKMPFVLAKFPRKLLANEWLVESVPATWYRLRDAVSALDNDDTVMRDLRHRATVVLLNPVDDDGDGWTEWHLNDHIHRDDDLPAVEWCDGSKEWLKNGTWHRDGDLPTCEWADGSRQWWIDGGSAAYIIDHSGVKMWTNKDGRLHRDDDMPAIEWPAGDKEWWVYGHRHRENGLPACERADGAKAWSVNGLLIRSEGYGHKS